MSVLNQLFHHFGLTADDEKSSRERLAVAVFAESVKYRIEMTRAIVNANELACQIANFQAGVRRRLVNNSTLKLTERERHCPIKLRKWCSEERGRAQAIMDDYGPEVVKFFDFMDDVEYEASLNNRSIGEQLTSGPPSMVEAVEPAWPFVPFEEFRLAGERVKVAGLKKSNSLPTLAGLTRMCKQCVRAE